MTNSINFLDCLSMCTTHNKAMNNDLSLNCLPEINFKLALFNIRSLVAAAWKSSKCALCHNQLFDQKAYYKLTNSIKFLKCLFMHMTHNKAMNNGLSINIQPETYLNDLTTIKIISFWQDF